MKKKLLQLADAILSKEQAKVVKGGYNPGDHCSCDCWRLQGTHGIQCAWGLPRCDFGCPII